MGHAFVASAESPRVISPSTCRRQVEVLGMTKGGEASIKSSCRTAGIFLTLGGPLAYDNSGRVDVCPPELPGRGTDRGAMIASNSHRFN